MSTPEYLTVLLRRYEATRILASILTLAAILAMSPRAHGQSHTTFRLLYSFAEADGAYPKSNLIHDRDGNLYGTSESGGAYSSGTVFKLDAKHHETVLYSFTSAPDGEPHGGLIQDAAGNLYGTALFGGTAFAGTVFKVDATGKETVLYSFTGGTDGGMPNGGLIRDAEGNLYGTTFIGALCVVCGTVFKLDTTGTMTVLYGFSGGADGEMPNGGLVRDTQGTFYGTTEQGGDFGLGTVFRLDAEGNETVLHSFAGDDGADPIAGLVRDAMGNLYGVAPHGGAHGWGSVFQLDSAGTFNVLYSFTNGVDGGEPWAGLIRDAEGNLYGTTHQGGEGKCLDGCGTVFKVDTTGKLTVLHTFTGGVDGRFPFGALMMDAVGNLYGTAEEGGYSRACFGGCGTVFEIAP